jgi:hypothetical protein
MAEEAQESVLGPLRIADAGRVVVPAAEGLSRWEGCLRATVRIGRGIPVRAEGFGQGRGMLRLLQFCVSRLE